MRERRRSRSSRRLRHGTGDLVAVSCMRRDRAPTFELALRSASHAHEFDENYQGKRKHESARSFVETVQSRRKRKSTPISINAQILITWVSFIRNAYHPAFEYHSCQRDNQPITVLQYTGNRCEGGRFQVFGFGNLGFIPNLFLGTGYCFRAAPAVNVRMSVFDNSFMNNSRASLLVR